MPRVESRE